LHVAIYFIEAREKFVINLGKINSIKGYLKEIFYLLGDDKKGNHLALKKISWI
jgi:hypothetical protein